MVYPKPVLSFHSVVLILVGFAGDTIILKSCFEISNLNSDIINKK